MLCCVASKALSTHCCGVHPLLCAAWQGGLCAALGLAPGGMVPMVEPEYVFCYGNSLICFEGGFFFSNLGVVLGYCTCWREWGRCCRCGLMLLM